jgi:hypothetical protein
MSKSTPGPSPMNTNIPVEPSRAAGEEDDDRVPKGVQVSEGSMAF